jgi:iron complex outermembrane receptor protein
MGFSIDLHEASEKPAGNARAERRTATSFLISAGILFASERAFAGSPVINYAEMSFEELANIEISSVSKRPERLFDAAASVYVITAEQIRRSGATSLPEVLRLAPNLQVAQLSSTGYAISARGMNGSNNSAPNKLLVMVDGRSVYTPLFSGVFWDVQDVVLDDVDRIEVISGPGGTLWGINAVNGIINIITRSADSTRGALASARFGNRGSDIAFRYGGALGADGSYRVYGKQVERAHTSTESGDTVNDAMHGTHVGFRADWGRADNRLTVHGNAYTGTVDQPAPGSISISGVDLPLAPIPVSGANFITRWERQLNDGSGMMLQIYYDRTKRTVPPTFSETLDIADIQFQHSLQPSASHSVVWGANYRYSIDHLTNSRFFAFLPAEARQHWASVFAQDDIALRENLRLTIGARIERNDYTGSEFMPSLRMAWKFRPDHLLWSAASRAVRAPSRLDSDAFIPGTPPFLLRGGPGVRSEVANVYEVGYRGEPTADTLLSVTLFHNDYDHLRTQEIDPSRTFVVFANEMEGKASGVEMWGAYQVTPQWRLSAGITALRQRFRLKAGSNDIDGPNSAGKDPPHTWHLRSSVNISSGRELEIALRHVGALSSPAVPSYTTVDARVGWNLGRGLELSITGQNLIGSSHAEYGPLATRSRIGTGIFMALLWKM